MGILIETYHMWTDDHETERFVALKTFEGLFSGSDDFLLLSSMASLTAIAVVMWHNFPDYPENVSHVLRVLEHFAEVSLRVYTAVGMFWGAGPYGFIPLFGSIGFRLLARLW